MVSTTVIALPLSLAVFASLFANDMTNSASPSRSLEQTAAIECTEVTLEYQVGDRIKSTESGICL